jgi:hypothetical protein
MTNNDESPKKPRAWDQARIKKQKVRMIEALTLNLGIITSACNTVGISRETHYRWTRKDERYRKDCSNTDDVVLDFAESHLHKAMSSGNVSAIKFFLKTKGRKRGYVEFHRIEQTGKIEITNKYDNMSDEELINEAKKAGINTQDIIIE